MGIINGKILIVDDDPYIILSLQTLLERHYSDIRTLKNPEGIPGLLNRDQVDVVILDMNFRPGDTSGQEGIRWLKWIQENDPAIGIVLITAYGGISIAVEAIKDGAVDFIVKPWQNEKLLATVSAAFKLCVSRRTLDKHRSREKILGSTIDDHYAGLIGNSPVMDDLRGMIAKVSGTDANVLILGENGTGKELVAREIHRHSQRSGEVFIPVDLGAIPESLFESELFGYRKGAFTDAREDRTGRIEAASGGTLFFDEIGNLPLPLQAKILSVLQNREVYKVGGTKGIGVDIRLVCATNQELHRMVAEGTFRQDLLYRINTVEITIPPLREHPEDIPLLADYFLKRYAPRYRKKKPAIPARVMKKIGRYEWPGNIRELQHAIQRAVIMSEGEEIKSSDLNLSEPMQRPGSEIEDLNLDKLEKWAIARCLKKHSGNVTRTAAELGLTRGALYRRMEKYGI